MTTASSKLAKAEEIAALRGLRAAVGHYIEATEALAAEHRADAAVDILAEILTTRERKRGLFGTKEIDPLGPDRAVVGRQFAKLTRLAHINDDLLELLAQLATEQPDDPGIRLANAEGLYRGGYIADAIDEYRFCEKLIPDDPSIVARLGALYAEAGRGPEAEHYLQRGIGDLMQAQRFDEVPSFVLAFLRVAPHAHHEVVRWLESLPDEILVRQHEVVAQILETAGEMGFDDTRWSAMQARGHALAAAAADAAQWDQTSAPWGVQTAYAQEVDASSDEAFVGASVDLGGPEEIAPQLDSLDAAQAGEEDVVREGAAWSGQADSEEMLGVGASSPEAQDVEANPPSGGDAPWQPQPAAANGSSKAHGETGATFTAGVGISIGSTQPTSGGGLPPGLAAFTRRKADAAFAAGDLAAAAVGYERLHRASFDPEVAARLATCYEALGRLEDAAALRAEIGGGVSQG